MRVDSTRTMLRDELLGVPSNALCRRNVRLMNMDMTDKCKGVGVASAETASSGELVFSPDAQVKKQVFLGVLWR